MKCSDCVHYEAHKFFNPSFFDGGKQPGDVERRCAMFREKEEDGQRIMWISAEDMLPAEFEEVLAIVNGNYGKVLFNNAVALAAWDEDGGWMLTDYPEAEEVAVSKWAYIPEPEN